MSDQFPLTKSLGLEVYSDIQCWECGGSGDFISVIASDLEALLEKGLQVNGHFEKDKTAWFTTYPDDETSVPPTHSALLINIQPIVKDTADKVIADFLRYIGDTKLCSAGNRIVERMRRVKRP